MGHVFGKLTTPSGMFVKQKTQILIAHQKEEIDRTQKKYSYSAKKIPLGSRAFCTCFWEVDHPLWDVCKAKNSNSYCSSEGRNRSNPIKYSCSAKKVRLGFRAFRTCFLN